MNKYIIPGYVKFNYNDFIYLENHFTGLTVELELKYNQELELLYKQGTNNLDSELTKFLFDNKLLIDSDYFKEEINSFFEIYDSLLRVIVFTTEKCNFRCPYCYEEHQLDENGLNYDLIFKFIIEKCKSNKEIEEVVIMYFGGEPLLKAKEILKFQEKVNDYCNDNNILSNGSITTNGYLLNLEYLIN